MVTGPVLLNRHLREGIPAQRRQAEVRHVRMHSERKLKHILGSVSADISRVEQLQDELAQTEEKYRTILEQMDEGYYEVDAKGNLTFLNEATARMYGCTREEMLGMSYKVYTPREHWGAIVEDYARVFVTGNPHRNRAGFGLKKNGTLAHREDSIFPIRNEKGVIVGLRGIARDVTERKLAEEALKTQKQFLEIIIESLPGIFYVIAEDLSFMLYNKNALRATGYTAEEVPNLRALDIVAPEDRERVTAILMDTFAKGSTFTEADIVTKDGRRVPYSLTGSRATIGGKTYLIGMATDISYRKAVEQAKENIEKNYRVLAENTSDVVTIMDMDFNITWLSASCQKLTGYSREEQRRLPFDKMMTAESLQRALEHFAIEMEVEKAGTAAPDRYHDIELEIYHKDGHTIWTENRLHLIRDSRGEAVGILMQGRDISERKKAEEALRKTMQDLKRSNEELEQFAYVASHDLQEPLRMVSSYVQLLEKRYKDNLDDDARDFINFAVNGSRRMRNLINDLLSYSRVGTRGKPFLPVKSSEIFEAAASNLEIAIGETGAAIEHGALPQITVDEGQMVQVFQNLLGNAIKFHGNGPPLVRVDAVRKNGDWVFSVEDNGIGIDPQYFERIFLVFQRLNGNEYPGTGIGLSVARKIVERHGGRIWLESEPGKGSIFYFTIPVREDGGKNE
jgi:PAS domain S-box-containing protein